MVGSVKTRTSANYSGVGRSEAEQSTVRQPTTGVNSLLRPVGHLADAEGIPAHRRWRVQGHPAHPDRQGLYLPDNLGSYLHRSPGHRHPNRTSVAPGRMVRTRWMELSRNHPRCPASSVGLIVPRQVRCSDYQQQRQAPGPLLRRPGGEEHAAPPVPGLRLPDGLATGRFLSPTGFTLRTRRPAPRHPPHRRR